MKFVFLFLGASPILVAGALTLAQQPPVPPPARLAVSAAAFSPDARFLLAGYTATRVAGESLRHKHLALWEVATGKGRWTQPANTGVVALQFLPADARHAVVAGEDGSVKVWDVVDGKPIRTFDGQRQEISCLAVTPDGRQALVGGNQGLQLWDVASGRAVRMVASGAFRAITVSRDGLWVLAFVPTADGSTVALWDLVKGTHVRSFPSRQGWATPLAFAPDTKLAAAGRWRSAAGGKDQVVLWKVSSGEEVRAFDGGALAIAFTPDGRRLLSGSKSGRLGCWDLDSGKETWFVQADKEGVRLLAFSADGRLAFSAAGEDVVGENRLRLNLWDTLHGKRLRPLSPGR